MSQKDQSPLDNSLSENLYGTPTLSRYSRSEAAGRAASADDKKTSTPEQQNATLPSFDGRSPVREDVSEVSGECEPWVLCEGKATKVMVPHCFAGGFFYWLQSSLCAALQKGNHTFMLGSTQLGTKLSHQKDTTRDRLQT